MAIFPRQIPLNNRAPSHLFETNLPGKNATSALEHTGG